MRAQKSEAFKILDWVEINLELYGKVKKYLMHLSLGFVLLIFNSDS
jgi:hypothetical protein